MSAATIFFLVLVGAVGACRIVELRLSRRHQRALAAGGAAPLPEPVFPAMVALHTGILVGAVAETLLLSRPFVTALAIPAIAGVALANALRFWVIATLGVHWNVRVVASMPLGVVTGGPYRFVRHPNYVAVFVELAALPLVHGAYLTAIAGALLHAAVLHRRVALEESVLMADDSYRRAFERKPRFLPLSFGTPKRSDAPRDPWPMS
jgi:methyltransferase